MIGGFKLDVLFTIWKNAITMSKDAITMSKWKQTVTKAAMDDMLSKMYVDDSKLLVEAISEMFSPRELFTDDELALWFPVTSIKNGSECGAFEINCPICDEPHTIILDVMRDIKAGGYNEDSFTLTCNDCETVFGIVG